MKTNRPEPDTNIGALKAKHMEAEKVADILRRFQMSRLVPSMTPPEPELVTKAIDEALFIIARKGR